jgi:hypothetical protein
MNDLDASAKDYVGIFVTPTLLVWLLFVSFPGRFKPSR